MNDFEKYNRVLSIKKKLKLKIAKDVSYARYGSEHDGGYVMASDITSNDYLISMGVEQNVDFEKDFETLVSGTDLYDFSVDGTPEPIANSRFFKEKIGLKENNDTNLATCIERVDASKDLILKIDIEGGEWDAFYTTNPDELSRFRQIIVEFHDMDKIEDDHYFDRAIRCISNILSTHTPVMLHANNNAHLALIGNSPVPPVFEVLFLRNSSYSFEDYFDPFKDLLTWNDHAKPDVGLTFP